MVSGWEFVNVQFGADFPLGHAFAPSPYVTGSLGQYGNGSLNTGGQSSSVGIPS